MSIGETAALLGAGMAAGGINTIVGSGTLLTFPTLLAFGYSPVVANVTNTVGLVPGSASGIYGYRAEVAEFRAAGRHRVLRLVSASFLGGITGALLLLVLPAAAFKAIVPVLILLALVLVVVQPRLARRLAARRAAASEDASGDGARAPRFGGLPTLAAVFGTGVYGGYFGAAQGVLLMAILGIAYSDRMQLLNGVKNILACVVNAVAAVVFIVAGALGGDHPKVVWSAALTIAVGATLGGMIGARVGRRLSPTVLRALIIVVGLVAVVKILVAG